MSKKKNNNEAVNETAEVVEAVESVETPVEEPSVEAAPAEEVVEEASATVEAPAEEAPKAEEPVAPAAEEIPVVEKELSEVEFEKVENKPKDPEPVAPAVNAVPEAPAKVADPLPEVNGKYYVNFGDMSDKKEAKVIAVIDKCGFGHIVTAIGEVLAGPFATDAEANAARKKIAGLGYKGVVFTFE